MRHWTKRMTGVAAVAAAASLILAGCSGGGSGGDSGATGTYKPPAKDVTATLTVSNWGNPGDEKIYAAAIARFNKKYPKVKVVDKFSEVTDWGDYVTKVQSMISSGQAPDVINIATEGVEYGLSKHLFLDLNNYIKQDKGAQALLKDQYPPVVQGFTKNGSTYLIPNNWNTNLVFYNTDMFAAAGIPRPADNWTWADFEADAKKLTQGSGGSKVYGIGLGTQTFAYMPWIYSNDGSTASADLKEPTLDSPATVGAVQFLADLVKNGYAPNPTGSDPAQLFQSGKVAMATPAGAAGFAAALDADPGVKWDVLPLPGNKSQENVFGAAGFAIYKNSKNKDLAWELTKELGGEGTQKAWAESFSSNPTTLTALKSAAYIKGKPHADLFWDLPKGTKPVAAPTFYTSLDAEFQKALSSIYAGGDVKSALTTANNNVKTTIANNG